MVISVEDSGIGIKEEDQKKLFRIFGKVGGQKSCTINPQGIGLGLVICNKILRQFDSQLQVYSKYGQGCKFYFELTLPCIRKSEDEIKEEKEVNFEEILE